MKDLFIKSQLGVRRNSVKSSRSNLEIAVGLTAKYAENRGAMWFWRVHLAEWECHSSQWVLLPRIPRIPRVLRFHLQFLDLKFQISNLRFHQNSHSKRSHSTKIGFYWKRNNQHEPKNGNSFNHQEHKEHIERNLLRNSVRNSSTAGWVIIPNCNLCNRLSLCFLRSLWLTATAELQLLNLG